MGGHAAFSLEKTGQHPDQAGFRFEAASPTGVPPAAMTVGDQWKLGAGCNQRQDTRARSSCRASLVRLMQAPVYFEAVGWLAGASNSNTAIGALVYSRVSSGAQVPYATDASERRLALT